MIRKFFFWTFSISLLYAYILISANYKQNPDWEFAQKVGNIWNEWVLPLIVWTLLAVFLLWFSFKVKVTFAPGEGHTNPVTKFFRPYWRKRTRYKNRWKSAMVLCDLYRLAGWQGKEKCVPKFKKIRSNGYIDTVSVRLIMGMSPRDFESRADALAHAFGARSCRVKSPKPGLVDLEFEISDALAKKLPALPISKTVDFTAIPVGISENGETWTVNILKKHILLAGIQGSGKSSLLQALIRGLGPAIHDGSVELRIIDPKGGMEFSALEPLCTYYEDEDFGRMVEVLEQTVKDMQARAQYYASQKIRKYEPSAEEPLVILIVDEFATLTYYMPEGDLRKRFERNAGLYLTQGRGPGFRMWAAAQDPRMEIVKFRHLFPLRMALELDKPEQVNWVLGEGMRAKGALADKIDQPGIVYLKEEGKKEPERKLVAYVENKDINELVTNYPRPTIQPQTVGPNGEVNL